MSHGSLGTERIAVRRNVNAGDGFLETHGLHGIFEKLFQAAVKWGHQSLLVGTQKVSEKNLCIRANHHKSMLRKGFRRTPCRALGCAIVRSVPESHDLQRASPHYRQRQNVPQMCNLCNGGRQFTPT